MDYKGVNAVVEEERKAAHSKVVEALLAEYEQRFARQFGIGFSYFNQEIACEQPKYIADLGRRTPSRRYGMTTLMDDAIGRILDTLEQTGLAENTIVVFLSDHGEYMGDHGFLGKGFHYDCVIRTPLIFAGPDIKQQRISEVESVLDIAPTLLDMVGVGEPEGTQGISLKEALNGAEAPRDAVMTENDDDFGPMYVRTLTTKDWKLTCYLNQPLGELYDRKNAQTRW